jgi:deoxyribonuclease V
MAEPTGEPWPTTVAEARSVQERLRARVETCDRLGPVRRIAGIDAHYDKARGLAFAAVAVLDSDTLELVESALAARQIGFPYVPGYLSFREAPAVLHAVAVLRRPPDLLLVDGQGIAHPRRFGLAAHLGVLLDRPAIGVAKSRLFGSHDVPGPRRGDAVPLLDGGATIGVVVRTRPGTRPLYVSIGHRVGLATALAWTERTLLRHRLPEPVRLADRLSRAHD